MKQALILFSLLLISFSTLAQSNVVIEGHIRNFKKYLKDVNSVEVIINDLAFGDQVTYREKIDANGSFKIKFPKDQPQDIYFEYKDLKTLFVKPGDSLVLNFDAEDFDNTVVFAGSGKKVNEDILLYQKERKLFLEKIYGKPNYLSEKFLTMLKDSSEVAYKAFLYDELEHEKSFLQEFNRRSVSHEFKKWALYELEYGCAHHLMSYVLFRNMNGRRYEPSSVYYDFFDKFPLDNQDAEISSMYGSFLNEYRVSLSLKTQNPNIKYLIANTKGFARDVILAIEFSQLVEAKNIEEAGAEIESLKSYVSTPYLKNKILDNFTKEQEKFFNYKLSEKAVINAVPITEADSIFSKIVAKYPGKVIYLDFWATWCGPCKAEMPNSKLLREKLKGEDVVFVYLGVQSPEKTWKAVIAELEMNGENYLLKDNDYRALSAKFQISGIPHYVLVDKKGRVKYDNAKRPGDAGLEKEIKGMLKD